MQGDLRTALFFYDFVIVVHPEHAIWRYQRGTIYINLGELDKGEADWRMAVASGNLPHAAAIIVDAFCHLSPAARLDLAERRRTASAVDRRSLGLDAAP